MRGRASSGGGPALLSRWCDQWDAGEDLLKVHDLAGEELGDGDGDDIGEARSWSGPKLWMPHATTLGKSSSVHSCSPTSATQSGQTVAGSSSMRSASPWPVRAATAMACQPGYRLAGVPMSGWESIHRTARSSP